jgi:hypothetical protein
MNMIKIKKNLGCKAYYVSLKFILDRSKLTEPYLDPSNYVEPDTADRFIVSYLLLQIITLN